MASSTFHKKKVQEALSVLGELGFPGQQLNERSALTLLSLLDLAPQTPWSLARSPLRGISPMMAFFREYYGKKYAPNTRETVRRQTVHQFLQAGLIVANPDAPARPVNSPKAVYQIEARALELLQTYGTSEWAVKLQTYKKEVIPLAKLYAKERDMARIAVTVPTGTVISLSPGGQNVLVKQVIEGFCDRFTLGADLIYVGDTKNKWAFFEKEKLKSLGITIQLHGKMPDVIVYYRAKGWIVLIEAVTSHGPVNPKRHKELRELFVKWRSGLVFVTAFMNRHDMLRYLNDIAWETEVWIASDPSHLIHFNGERFLGPYAEV